MSQTESGDKKQDKQNAEQLASIVDSATRRPQQSHPQLSVDISTVSYMNAASAVFANALRVIHGQDADENPIPGPGVECYMNGEKLPPLLTGLYDGELGYGYPIDNINEIHQRRIAQASFIALVNWYNKHADTIKKRQNLSSTIIQTFALGKLLTDTFSREKDEAFDDYIARVESIIKQKSEQPETEPEPEIVTKAKKTKEPKESKEPKEQKESVATTKKTPKSTKKPVLQVESDTESISEVKDDSEDTEILESESSEESSEKKPVNKKKFGRR